MKWLKNNRGGWVSDDGHWVIRRVSFLKITYWLYRDHTRYTPTGKFEDSLYFTTANRAKKYVESLTD